MTQVRPIYGCLIVIVVLALVLGGYYAFRNYALGKAMEERLRNNVQEAIHRQDRSAGQISSPLPGEAILQSYALPTTRPEDDLNALAHVFSNLTLLIKGDSPFPMGANEEFAAALRGKNRTRLRFMPDAHRAFNAQGQIVDRWDTPVFFHVTDHTRIDIRSAGPDGKMWTADDLHRRYDGQFLARDALNPPSLYVEPGAKKQPSR